MTAPRMADTRQCPFCKAWIPMPARFAHKAFNAHKAKCITSHECTTECLTPASTATRRADAPAFNPLCGLCGADIAADPFHNCAPAAPVDPQVYEGIRADEQYRADFRLALIARDTHHATVKRATTERPYPANASERHALAMANAYIETITRPTQGALL